jgi:RNA polymerase sigma-70 factor (ECF subfamily)
VGETDFATIYRDHLALVRRLLGRCGIRGADLDDGTHEAFITIHRLLPEFEGRASLETWMQAIVWRVAAGYLRRAHRRYEVASGSPEALAEDGAAAGLSVEDLHASLGRIGPDERDLVALHEIGGLSISELSELTGRARATIAQRLERTTHALARSLSTIPITSQTATSPECLLMPQGVTSDWAMRRWATYDHERPGYCFSRVGDCVLGLFRTPSTLQQIGEATELLLSAAESTRDGITYMSVIEGTSGPPDRAGRQANGWAAAKLKGKVRAAAFVPESPRMRALVVPIINTYVFLARNPLPIRFFGTVGGGASWLAPLSRTDAEGISTRIDAMRSCLDRQVAHAPDDCSRI